LLGQLPVPRAGFAMLVNIARWPSSASPLPSK
jgi:hypothetical protein